MSFPEARKEPSPVEGSFSFVILGRQEALTGCLKEIGARSVVPLCTCLP